MGSSRPAAQSQRREGVSDCQGCHSGQSCLGNLEQGDGYAAVRGYEGEAEAGVRHPNGRSGETGVGEAPERIHPRSGRELQLARLHPEKIGPWVTGGQTKVQEATCPDPGASEDSASTHIRPGKRHRTPSCPLFLVLPLLRQTSELVMWDTARYEPPKPLPSLTGFPGWGTGLLHPAVCLSFPQECSDSTPGPNAWSQSVKTAPGCSVAMGVGEGWPPGSSHRHGGELGSRNGGLF